MARPMINIKRTANIDGSVIKIESKVVEQIQVDDFQELYRQKIQQANSLDQQLQSVKQQITAIDIKSISMTDTEKAELAELSAKISIIESMSKLDKLRESAQQMEIDLDTLREDIATFAKLKRDIPA